jgi:hypothetical protein
MEISKWITMFGDPKIEKFFFGEMGMEEKVPANKVWRWG